MKGLGLAALLALATTASALPTPQEAAKAELMKIKEAYERGLSNNKPDLIMPYLDDNFGGKMLFKNIQGKQGMKDFLNKISQRFGEKENARGYEVKLKPEKIEVKGDDAKAEGTTEETVDTPLGQIVYNTTWKADLQKKNGSWKLTHMDSQLDPKSSLSRFVASFVSAAWLKDNSIAPPPAAAGTAKDYRHRFKHVAATNPDFDGDR